ncbi:uncharacterized protein LOC120339282 isoform X6 [Styela clava]
MYSTLLLWLPICICIHVYHANGAPCDKLPGDTSFDSGEVFENAPTGVIATTLGLEGSVGDFTLMLTGDLDKYFEAVGKEIKVKNGSALTRDDPKLKNPSRAERISISGSVQCYIGLSFEVNYAARIDMNYINKYNPTIISDDSKNQSEYVAVGAVIPFPINAGSEGSGDPSTDTNVFEISSQNPADIFNISDKGVLTLAKDLDYAKYKTHTINLLLKNTGLDNMGNDKTLAAAKTITIIIQDYDDLPPVFLPCDGDVCQPLYSLNINVGQSTGSLNVEPGPIEAKDGDIGINQDILYSFISGTPEDYATYLDINNVTGEVTLKTPIISPTTYTIAVKAQQTNRADRFAVTYLQAIATAKDEHPPTFSETSYSGGVVNDGSDILFVYKTGSTDLLQLVATDGDDANATIIFTTKDPTPYQISSEGYIFVRSSQLSTTRSTSSDLKIVAVNVYADTTSSNRESAPITVSIAVTEVTTQQTTEGTTEPITTEASTTVEPTTPVATTIPTTEPTTTFIDTTTSTSVSGATETTKNLEETTRDGFTNEVSMVPASTLYGVAAGLSVALFIAILAIIYLIWRLMKKDKDSKFDDDDEDNVSTSINGNAHMYENGAFTEHETSKEIDERPPPMMVTFTGNPPIIEPGEERDNINEETGSNHSSEADLLGNETEAMDFSAPQDPEYATVNKEENTEIHEEEPFGYDNMAEPDTAPKSDFEEELMQRQRQMVAPAVPVAAVLLNESMEDDVNPISDQERKNFRLSPEKIQEERIIKEDAVTTVKLVTLKGYGDDNGDVKAVLKSIDLSMATGTEEQSVRSQIATMEKLGELDHENILTYYGSYERDGYLHYATKYAENGCLQDKLRNSNVDANTRMHIMADIGRGLQYLHANNIVHGKLWGKSIMLDANNKPKLTDFQNDDSIVTDYGDMMRWQALEVNEQTSGRTAVSDVWSYGTVMWEIVSDGAVPYDGVPVFDLPTHMRENQLPKPKACSDSLFSIMTTCWNTDPKMRPDMYVINSNLSEKLLEDSNNLIGSQTSVRSSSSLSTRLFGDNKVRPDWSDHESKPSPDPPVARTTSAWV